jgi:hypothetical protein
VSLPQYAFTATSAGLKRVDGDLVDNLLSEQRQQRTEYVVGDAVYFKYPHSEELSDCGWIPGFVARGPMADVYHVIRNYDDGNLYVFYGKEIIPRKLDPQTNAERREISDRIEKIRNGAAVKVVV